MEGFCGKRSNNRSGLLDLVLLLVMAAGFLYVLFVVVIIGVEAFRAARRRQSSTPSGYEENYRSLS